MKFTSEVDIFNMEQYKYRYRYFSLNGKVGFYVNQYRNMKDGPDGVCIANMEENILNRRSLID